MATPTTIHDGLPHHQEDAEGTSSQPLTQLRRPVAPYIPASRADPSDAFTGYSEPIPASPYVSIRGLYATTSFDTLSVLSRVYTRPNPKIELGPVDDSVSFVVVDSKKDDFPIVYVSENFKKLTGYSREEIVGRNCRFLQYPPPDVNGGDVSGGEHMNGRSPAVEAFKRSLALGQECQASLMNFRRDGEAFLNLISVIPIKWKDEKTGEEMEYHVGFQVDLHRALSQDPAVEEPVGPPKVSYDPSDPAIKSSHERWSET